MNNKFDELTKDLAQSVTRRQALKKFGVGLAVLALACFGMANKAGAIGVRKGGNSCTQCIKFCESRGGTGPECKALCQSSGSCP